MSSVLACLAAKCLGFRSVQGSTTYSSYSQNICPSFVISVSKVDECTHSTMRTINVEPQSFAAYIRVNFPGSPCGGKCQS
jgi:hypothetical protein